MLRRALNALEADGAEVIDLEVSARNVEALRLYTEHGFEPMASLTTWRAGEALCVDHATQTR